jgi:hypothetical protein
MMMSPACPLWLALGERHEPGDCHRAPSRTSGMRPAILCPKRGQMIVCSGLIRNRTPIRSVKKPGTMRTGRQGSRAPGRQAPGHMVFACLGALLHAGTLARPMVRMTKPPAECQAGSARTRPEARQFGHRDKTGDLQEDEKQKDEEQKAWRQHGPALRRYKHVHARLAAPISGKAMRQCKHQSTCYACLRTPLDAA